MSRSARCAGVAAALASAALIGPDAGPAAGGDVPAPGAVAVSAREFSLTLSRPTVVAGRVRVQLQNAGEDDHDLRVERRADGRAWHYPVAHPGEAQTRTLRLRPGRYRLICTLEGHEALGMHVRLRVTRR